MGAIKLIDLDQEIFVPIYDEAQGITYEQIMTVADMFDKFMSGYQPPIVDAIPVEWLENRLTSLFMDACGAGAIYGDKIGELASSINNVMRLWEKEQEAHGT